MDGDLPGAPLDVAVDMDYLWVGTTAGLVRFRLVRGQAMTDIPLGAGAEFDRIRAIAAALGPAASGLGNDCAVLRPVSATWWSART